MSYILDALKRAENERTSSSAAGSGSAHAGTQGAGVHPATMVLAGATLFLAGIGVAALLLRTATNAPRPDATPATVVQTAPPTAAPVPTLAAVDSPAPAESTEPAVEPLALDDYGSFDDITPVFQGTNGPAGAAESSSAAAVSAASEPEAIATAAPNTLTLPATPPQLDDMPADFRARFPNIQLQVHVHDAEPARRWIMVDGRRYPEGSVLSQGPRVIEILPDGVIFELSGQRVRWPLAR